MELYVKVCAGLQLFSAVYYGIGTYAAYNSADRTKFFISALTCFSIGWWGLSVLP